MKYITKYTTATLTLFISIFVQFHIGTTFAAIDCENENIPEAVRISAGCELDGEKAPDLQNTTINIINAIIAILGLVAVIFVVYGGIQYMLSTGDSIKTKKAKDTILYAAIGLIICVLSYAIVNFVIIDIIGGLHGVKNGYTNPNDCVNAGGQYIGGDQCFFQ